MIENRSVWGIILVVVVCGMLCMYAFADAGGEARFVRQMVGRDETMRTFVWQSDVLDERMRLVYRRCGEDSLGEVCPTVERCAVGDDTFFRYRAELNGLVRGAEYEYAVTNDRTDVWYRFHVADSRYTALIFTDSQCSGDYHMWHEVVRTAKKEAASADLCLHLGDLVDCGASRYQWERWLTGAEEVLLSCAFAPTVGNHEDYTTDWQMTLPHWYRALFPVVKNDDGELDGYVYSFDYGDVHYAVLDTQAEELSAWKDDWAARQT
ncbi:MAG: metallophosphoesterase, partial [Selenomonadales bacterium]|nr:metallophosphoesterase [Selenomonadales bacterium]